MDKDTYKYLVQLSLNCIQERKKSKNCNYNDLIQMLIQTGLPDDEIVGQCIGLFLGGFESVAQTCAFTLYELSLQPNLQDRLYKEIEELYPGENLDIDYDMVIYNDMFSSFFFLNVCFFNFLRFCNKSLI